jgi:hypothetical protein
MFERNALWDGLASVTKLDQLVRLLQRAQLGGLQVLVRGEKLDSTLVGGLILNHLASWKRGGYPSQIHIRQTGKSVRSKREKLERETRRR